MIEIHWLYKSTNHLGHNLYNTTVQLRVSSRSMDGFTASSLQHIFQFFINQFVIFFFFYLLSFLFCFLSPWFYLQKENRNKYVAYAFCLVCIIIDNTLIRKFHFERSFGINHYLCPVDFIQHKITASLFYSHCENDWLDIVVIPFFQFRNNKHYKYIYIYVRVDRLF